MFKNSKLLPIDIITYIYILFNLVYITIGRNRIENAGVHLIIYSLIAVIIAIIVKYYKPDSNLLFYALRHAYPFFLYAYFFNVSTLVNFVVFPGFIDPFFQHIDELIFGYQPAIEWGMRYNHIIIQEIFHFAYFSYYIVIPGVALLILLYKKEYFPKYFFTVTFVFYICYITYSFLPVVGARYWPEIYELTMTPRGGPFTRIMAVIYSNTQHFGSAVPSSHVAITIIVNIAAFRYSKKLGYALIPLTILLSISTVYCHYHYFIDVVFGIIFAFALFIPAEKAYDYLCKCRQSSVNEHGSPRNVQ